jgi:hypothetical protein
LIGNCRQLDGDILRVIRLSRVDCIPSLGKPSKVPEITTKHQRNPVNFMTRPLAELYR